MSSREFIYAPVLEPSKTIDQQQSGIRVTVESNLSASFLSDLVRDARDRAMMMGELRDARIHQDVMQVYAVALRVCGVQPRDIIQ